MFKHLNKDIPASLVVFFVALPLCLGIALASGAPLFSGLIAGMVGGVVVGSLSGSSLGVSGPAAGLAVIVLGAIHSLGSFESFPAGRGAGGRDSTDSRAAEGRDHWLLFSFRSDQRNACRDRDHYPDPADSQCLRT